MDHWAGLWMIQQLWLHTPPRAYWETVRPPLPVHIHTDTCSQWTLDNWIPSLHLQRTTVREIYQHHYSTAIHATLLLICFFSVESKEAQSISCLDWQLMIAIVHQFHMRGVLFCYWWTVLVTHCRCWSVKLWVKTPAVSSKEPGPLLNLCFNKVKTFFPSLHALCHQRVLKCVLSKSQRSELLW